MINKLINRELNSLQICHNLNQLDIDHTLINLKILWIFYKFGRNPSKRW